MTDIERALLVLVADYVEALLRDGADGVDRRAVLDQLEALVAQVRA